MKAGAIRFLPSYYIKNASCEGHNEKACGNRNTVHGLWNVSYAFGQRQIGGSIADPYFGGGRVFLPD